MLKSKETHGRHSFAWLLGGTQAVSKFFRPLNPCTQANLHKSGSRHQVAEQQFRRLRPHPL